MAPDEQPAAAFLVGGQKYESSLTGEDIDDNLLEALAMGGQGHVPPRGLDRDLSQTDEPKRTSRVEAGPEPDDSIPVSVLISLIVAFGFVALVARPQLATSPGFAWLVSMAIFGLVVIGIVDRVLRHASR